jgi:hypothetical protein
MSQIFNGSFCNDRRLVLLSNHIDFKLDTQLMLSVRQTKSFPIRFKISKEDNEPILLGIVLRLESLRSNLVKEHEPN